MLYTLFFLCSNTAWRALPALRTCLHYPWNCTVALYLVGRMKAWRERRMWRIMVA